ncbi:MAG: hypothetical protein K2N92_02350 [Malacoplasma sp.]|nr:hypothetical protein [Malacoplasma sp.]MDE7112420.1 hypothetical protein [Malacoplasma sp.]
MNNINELQKLEYVNSFANKIEIFDEKILNDEVDCAFTLFCFTFSCLS